MFWERLISGIVLIFVAVLTIMSGEGILITTLTIISIIGMIELLKVKKMNGQAPGIVAYVVTAAYYGLLEFSGLDFSESVLVATVVLFVVLAGIYVFSYPKYNYEQITLVVFAFFYVTILMSYVYHIRTLGDGIYLVWLVFLCSWGCDTCAYCVGVLFGKHKMSPKLSPKKSIEGAVGGAVGAGVLGGIYGFCMNTFQGTEFPIYLFVIICVVGGIISMIGDLLASGIKRDGNIKDYGKLIPGHGGILDRFDSMIFISPVLYYLLLFFV